MKTFKYLKRHLSVQTDDLDLAIRKSGRSSSATLDYWILNVPVLVLACFVKCFLVLFLFTTLPFLGSALLLFR